MENNIKPTSILKILRKYLIECHASSTTFRGTNRCDDTLENNTRFQAQTTSHKQVRTAEKVFRRTYALMRSALSMLLGKSIGLAAVGKTGRWWFGRYGRFSTDREATPRPNIEPY